jgi:PEP-CTERM motif
MFTFRKTIIGAALAALMSTTPAFAADYIFNFGTSRPLFGGPGSGSGTISTDGVTFDSRGFTAQRITGVQGMFNGAAITGLASPFGANNLYYLTGPSFVDGSGLGFATAAGTSVNLFFQGSAGSYRINTVNPFTSSFVDASSSALGGVPEPTTWAMLILGFGLIGAGMRRRVAVRAKLSPSRAFA